MGDQESHLVSLASPSTLGLLSSVKVSLLGWWPHIPGKYTLAPYSAVCTCEHIMQPAKLGGCTSSIPLPPTCAVWGRRPHFYMII